MSVKTLTAVMDQSEAQLGARLVLFVLADVAHDDGITWITTEEIAHKTRLNPTYISVCLKRLVDSGEIVVRKWQRGHKRFNVYRVLAAPAEFDSGNLPDEILDLFRDDLRNPDLVDSKVATSDPTGVDSAVTRGRATARKNNTHDGLSLTVDRRKATDSELTLAQFVLSAWNGRTGQDLTAKSWLAKIIMRIREYPDLSLDDHVAIIDRNLANPWWRGAPTPAVIYGNDAVFEQSMQRQDSNGRGDRVLEPSEVAEALRNA